MTIKLNEILKKHDISINYDLDVCSISEHKNGGTVTERHILCAVANKLIARYGKGKGLTDFIEQELLIPLPEKIKTFLLDQSNPHYLYDLLGALKSDLVASFYVPATRECPTPETLVNFAKEIRAILAYAYLGDVGNSVTGDKKTQQFEDSYLDLLFIELKRLGFNAVTYMPSRNTLPQLLRIQGLCERHHLLEISGEDINSSRQSFICPQLSRPEFAHLTDATWALIGHEKAATDHSDNGFFTEQTIKTFPELKERIDHFKRIGRSR